MHHLVLKKMQIGKIRQTAGSDTHSIFQNDPPNNKGKNMSPHYTKENWSKSQDVQEQHKILSKC